MKEDNQTTIPLLCGPDGICQSGETARLVCDVVGRLLPLYSLDEKDSPDNAGGPLPDYDRVIEALQRLEECLFPGRLASERVGAHLLEPFLQERLSRAYRLLEPQVRRAIPFRWMGAWGASLEDPPPRVDPAVETVRVLGEFFAQLPAIRAAVIADVEAAYAGDPAALSYAEVVMAYPGLRAIATHRLAHELYALDVPIVPRLMSEHIHSQTGIDIHPGAQIGKHFFIDHGTGVVIGETTIIGDNVKLYQGVTLGAKSFPVDESGMLMKQFKRHPTLEDDVVVYAGATILGDIVIGRGAVIGGNVFLMKPVPAESKVLARPLDIEIRPNNASQ